MKEFDLSWISVGDKGARAKTNPSRPSNPHSNVKITVFDVRF